MRTISPFEFVRRFHHGLINHDGRYVWFLGAGCSTSAGIGDAGETALRWLGELKYLETGTKEGVAAWAPDRFAGYDPRDLAAIYGEVLDALFYTEQEQERELDRITAQAEPGFGYATLAQLVTQPGWGERCNTVITTNFDDLAADALYLYSQRKPQVLTHESFDRRIRISTSRPTILKIYGDAHLGLGRGPEQGRFLRSDVKDRLRAQFTEAALVFIGYGGRDDSVANLLSGLPQGAPAGGVYWVNEEEPGEPIRGWLEERNAFWTPYSDFEGLMYLIRREFDLGHPRIDRFDKILQRYDAQFHALSARSDLKPDTLPGFGAPVSPDAMADAAPVLASRPASVQPPVPPVPPAAPKDAAEAEAEWSYSLAGTVADGFDRHDVIAEEDMPAHGEDAGFEAETSPALFGEYDENRYDDDENGEDAASDNRIDRLIAAAVAAMANGQNDRRPGDTLLTETVSPAGETDEPVAGSERPDAGRPDAGRPDAGRPDAGRPDAGRPDAGRPAFSIVADEGADVAMAREDEPSEADTIATPPAEPEPATDARSAPSVPPSFYAQADDRDEEEDSLELPRRLLGRTDAQELDRRYLAAIQDTPGNARLLARYARFLAVGRRDHDGAEHHFNRAIDADPQDGEALREFATFLTDVRRNFDRAEECYRLALRVDFENTETLIAYADFLWKVRGDMQAAGECYQVAVDGAPRHARAIAAYADFLSVVERKDDAAYALLKLATASTTTDPEPAVRLARFVAEKRGDLGRAEAIYRQATRIDPRSAETMAAAAAFLADMAKKPDEAESWFERAVETDPASPEVLRAYARFMGTHRRDADAAEDLLTRALDADPGDARTALAYARFQEEDRSDLETADEYYRRAVHLDPRNATILSSHARFLHKARSNPAAAQDRYRKALALDAKDAFTLAQYGNFLLHERKDMDAAEPLLRRATTIAPRDAAALADLGLILRERGQDEEAEALFRRAVAADPRRVATLRRYARVVNTAKSNPAAAEAFYDKALAENPNDPATLCGAAQAMFSLGKREEGLSMLDRAFEAALDDDPARRDPDLLLELWFYRYAFDDQAGQDAIKAALWLVRAGARATRDDLDAVLKFAVKDGHAEPDLLSELASVACGESEPEQLRRFNVA